MQTRPSRNNWKAPNEHSLTLGSSGSNKSGMFKDLTKFQLLWQEAIIRASARTGKSRAARPPQILLQNGSVEGVLQQCGDNQGERLIIANDEAMSFYQGTGSHHQGAGTSIMTDLVCKLYDGEPYYKRLVKQTYTIPRALGTMIMATVFNKFSGWEDFSVMISSGAMSRTTVGIISRPIQRGGPRIKGAEEAMADMMFKLRSLRHCRFALEEAAHKPWSDIIDDCENTIRNLAEDGVYSGLLEWCRKYDTRIISMATALQAIDFVAGNMMNYKPYEIPRTLEEDSKIGGNEGRQGKLIHITYENLKRAIDFIKFLFETQKYFYGIADGISEFGPELWNWAAHKLTHHSPDTPDNNILTRTDLVYRGPTCVRPKNGVTDASKAKADRWVRALLDNGYIEVYDKPGARQMRRYKTEEQEANFKIRDEFFMKFSDETTMLEFRKHDEAMQRRLNANFSALQLAPKGN
jgi:hypothetical protein